MLAIRYFLYVLNSIINSYLAIAIIFLLSERNNLGIIGGILKNNRERF